MLAQRQGFSEKTIERLRQKLTASSHITCKKDQKEAQI